MFLYFIRHGESIWNVTDVRQGNSSLAPGLTEKGRQQAKNIKDHLPDFDVLFSSSLLRATQTTDILNKTHLPVILLDGLQERSLGEWEGKTWEEIEKIYPKEFSAFKETRDCTIPGLERLADYMSRTQRALSIIVEKSQGKNALIVTHGGFLRAVLAYLEQKPYIAYSSIDNCRLTTVEYLENTKSFKIHAINEKLE